MRECVIIGGGIHGTYLVQRLLEETALERSDVLIVDPNDQLLASFRRKARACEMDALRSTFVHHIGTEPFGLEDFAEARGREDELLSRPKYPRRPSLSLFLDYAEYVLERTDLSSLHRQATVTSIRRCERRGSASERPLILETDTGEEVKTRTCVLAMGHGGRYCSPDWADGIGEIEHIWDESFDPATQSGESIVVGGGITAAQVALCLADRAADGAGEAASGVTLLSRHDLETAAIEADPRWINWNHIERHLHRHPPGSQARADVIREARNDATIPPTLFERLESAAETETLSIRHGDVRSARRVDGRVRLVLENGGCCSAEQVVLATGFAPIFDHPFVEQVADELDLKRGYCGMPVLSDETLAWHRKDDTASRLFVSGALAAGAVGPLAGNIAGARRAADRLSAGVEAVVDPHRIAA
ncbi:FAD/NAD(P)-binding protein [Natronolimnobius baerhuensis]|uniref:Thioredoxin reductase n=1 Tax=Natronolimnobius baerhuensis TaxID=253108 RepID=A0A202E6A1_9EURY|nr:FAD/NAD(P)-binding protein [Natronolimnobius baerhuensis]OVE83759.1 thioredoxin reductase [Natronolimnobius baerhuensis]